MSIKFVSRWVPGFILLSSSLLAAQQLQPVPLRFPDVCLFRLEVAQDSNSSDPDQSTNQSKDQSAQTQNSSQAQQPATTPADPNAKPDAQNKNVGTSNTGTSNDRLVFALPNFLTLQNAGQVPPLTTGQKFKVVFRGSFDKVMYPWYGILSGISQAENSEPGYGQGWGAYGKRYAAYFADGTIENFMTSAVLPSLLHQDPRFFQESDGGFGHRAGYAVSRIFITRSDSGKKQFNYSEIFGSAIAAAISTNSYHPRSTIIQRASGPEFIKSDRTLGNTASVWGSQLGYDTITIVIKEFWPDLQRKISKKRNADPSANSSH